MLYFFFVKFGGTRYNFFLTLEMIVYLGKLYAFVPYEVCLERWENEARALDALEFQLARDADVAAAARTASVLDRLGNKPALRTHAPLTFFAHRRPASGGGVAAGSSSFAAHAPSQLHTSGRVMIDVEVRM